MGLSKKNSLEQSFRKCCVHKLISYGTVLLLAALIEKRLQRIYRLKNGSLDAQVKKRVDR
jgi:hypothetical protein